METLINDFDVFLCKGNSVTSEGITTVSNGKYSHSAQALWINNTLCIFDAQKEGSFPREYNRWKSEFGYEFDVFRPPFEVNSVQYSKDCINYFGVDYDYKHLFFGFWRKIISAKKVKDKYKNNNKFICTELTAKLIKQSSFYFLLSPIQDQQNFTPDDLYFYLVKNKFSHVLKNY
ncbi:MAG: hypothetical protein HYU67_04695 [Flavobacteriia bacterium]|nr:hypothetical protein [Flavobacteriia bacterium]